MLSTNFSKASRGTISEIKADKDKIVYSDIFPDVKVKKGESTAHLWTIEDGYNSYLATSPGGTATGFGATLILVDDLIKNVEEANNEMVLEKHWTWFTDTMLSRLEEGGKIIIVMTRWHSRDLAGRMIDHCQEEGWTYRHITMKALQDDGTMLCPSILSYASYKKKTSAMSEEIASANYQQIPIDIKGKLYQSFKTYDELPVDQDGNSLFTGIYSYCDTADEGKDYLCNIIWGDYNKEAYVLDVIYTKEPVEITEIKVAKHYIEYKVTYARIESNGGGKQFARNVNRIMTDDLGSNFTVVKWFHQSKNKQSRILTYSSWVVEHIYFPQNWRQRWPDYYKAMNSYQREGKNAHDDAPDATTGVAETMQGIYR